MIEKVKVGLYGTAGHQIHQALVNHPLAELTAVAGFAPDSIPAGVEPKVYPSLAALLADPEVHLVSLCSPNRRQQARETVQCLEAGKHVYAEKPSAMIEAELDAIIAAVQRTGCQFHEMAGTAFEQPYLAMREMIAAGTIGTVVQVLAQKSYPYHAARPQDEELDGGLLLQVGVHAARFIEHVGGVKMTAISAVETGLSNPGQGDLRMAVSFTAQLENGGLATSVCNYLNPPKFPSWGNEMLRIFGTEGFIEATDGGARTRLVLKDQDCGPLPLDGRPGISYIDTFFAALLGKAPMPLSLEDELHPLRMLIRAREQSRR